MVISEQKNNFKVLFDSGVKHLQKLISIPSFSNEEGRVSEVWENWLEVEGVKNIKRFYNNIYALNENFNPDRPILLLNSHMDTVKPVSSYTRDPFFAEIIDGKLFGLGSNDAGGAGIAMGITFLQLKDLANLPFNILFAITASEEKMGEFGMKAFLPHLKDKGLYPSMAIVGEPTNCEAAIAERGLVVCDAEVLGRSGHAARNEGINAIYRAINDIEKITKYKFRKESEVLGPIKVSVTMIDAGTQHNVIPDKCHYVADIRTTDAYSNEETVKILQKECIWSKLSPRSTRIQASVLNKENPLYMASVEMSMNLYVSPTTSDMALMHDIPSIKIGPGKSERSHTADEFIEIDEIKRGCEIYYNFILTLSQILHSHK